MPEPRRILVRGVNWLGDAVMTTPALLRLREVNPDARITLLTADKLAGLWSGHPAINDIETFQEGESLWSVARRLRAGGYDLGIVLPNSPRSALELWLGEIPQRVGYSGRGRGWMLTRSVPPEPEDTAMRKRPNAEIRRLIQQGAATIPPPPAGAHHIHHYLRLVSALGASAEPLAPFIKVRDEEVLAFGAKFGLETARNAADPCFALNPGAEYGPAKRWPEERFIAAAVELQKRLHCRWIIFGGAADAETGGRIAAKIGAGAANLSGKTSLRELCAGLKFCRVLLTNDSGPMHVAAAVGTPVVVPFGSTSPELTGPGMPGDTRHQLLKSGAPCSPCFRRECPIDFRCMMGIGVETVADAVARAATSQP